MRFRPLTVEEEALAREVFLDQLPYRKIYIADFFLPGNRGVAVTLASGAGVLPIRSLTSFTIYFGGDVYQRGADADANRNTFIHELTHVWQGYHSAFYWTYMLKSGFVQSMAVLRHHNRGFAYLYELDEGNPKPWREYNVEQQGNIVRDWFVNGMREDDPRYKYISENIRQGRT